VAGAGLLAIAALMAFARPARAGLVDDAERVARALAQRGAEVTRLSPIFLEHGRLRVIAPPPGARPAACETVLFLAGRSVDYVVDALAGEDEHPAEEPPPSATGKSVDSRTHSVSGVATLVRCGRTVADLSRVIVEMSSARGAIEVFVVRSDEPLGPLAEALPERAPGTTAPRGDPGPLPEPGPLEARVAGVERRARAEGAEHTAHVTMRASPRGAGEFDLRLGEGCHRVVVLGEVPPTSPRPPTDVDAEARLTGGRLLARDRGEAPDARLELCLGEPAMVEVPYVGAAGAMPVAMVDAVWPFPDALPAQWGPRARAAIGGALRKRRAPAPSRAPAFEALGAQGVTAVPVPTEPGRCYLAALGIVRGEPRGLRLAARLGERSARDEVAERGEGVALSFCAETEEAVTLDVEVRGSTPWWTLAVWPLGGAR
jgi:hypothetical protein